MLASSDTSCTKHYLSSLHLQALQKKDVHELSLFMKLVSKLGALQIAIWLVLALQPSC